MRCEVCGKEIAVLNSKDYTCPECGFGVYKPSNCDMPMLQDFGKQEGWICPICGRGVAPWASSCPCQGDWKITYGTGTGGANTELNKLFELNDARVSEIIQFNKKYGD